MPSTFVIFGASGDLTQRKLIPALYQLFRKGRLKDPTQILGFSRTRFSDDAWREELAATTAEFTKADFDEATWRKFAQFIHYQPGDIGRQEDFEVLGARLAGMEPPGRWQSEGRSRWMSGF